MGALSKRDLALKLSLILFQVDAPFEINDNVQPTELDSIGGWNGNVQFTVSGWGVTSVCCENSVFRFFLPSLKNHLLHTSY